MEAAVSAALAIARSVGLGVGRPVVLSSVATTVVHLVPQPVVARVVVDEPAARASAARELVLAAHLVEGGGAVAAPARSVDPGPHEAEGMLVSLWEHVDHDPTRPTDGERAGRALREVHLLLLDVDGTALSHFARLEENRALVAHLDLEPSQRSVFAEVLDAVEAVIDRLPTELQPVHGDAHLGNVLRASAGPVWNDFDKVCLAPPELDLACNEIRARHVGRTRTDDDFLLGYGDHDRDLVSLLVPVHLATLAAWTFDGATRRPELATLAAQRLDWAARALL